MEENTFDKTIENCFYINFLDYLDKDITYNNDLFYKVMQYDWKQVYNVIYNLLDDKEKEDFHLYNL